MPVAHEWPGAATKPEQQRLRSQPQSAVVWRVGSGEYPILRRSSTCKTCNHPRVVEIEHAILSGSGYVAIVRALGEAAGDLSPRNIMDHVSNGHLPVMEGIRAAALRDHADALGTSIERHAGTVIDHVMFARAGLQQAFEKLARGDLDIKASDAVAMARLLADVEIHKEDQVDQSAVLEAFGAYMLEAQKLMSRETFDQFGRALSKNPTLRQLMARGATRQDAVDAEAHEVYTADIDEEIPEARLVSVRTTRTIEVTASDAAPSRFTMHATVRRGDAEG